VRDLAYFNKIFLAVNPVDFRNQAHGLSVLVKQVLLSSPLDGRSLFVFTNKRKTSIRILYWDATGFALWSKVLEKHRFKWPKNQSEAALKLSSIELKWLLQGIDLAKIKKHEAINYSATY
jgi:transposase